MSAEDAQVLARFEAAIAAFNEGGGEAFLEFATEDVRLATASGFPGGGSFGGRVQVERYIQEFSSNWASVRYEYERPRVEHGAVVHLARWVVRGSEPGSEVSAEVFGVASFRGDDIDALELFWTEDEATKHARGER